MSKKVINFGVILSHALLATGKSEFDVDKDNNIVLSEEDKKKIKAEWGEVFLQKLEPLLNKDSEPTETESVDLRNAMQEHLKAEFEEELKSEQKKAADSIASKEAEISKLQKEKLQLVKENALLADKEEDLDISKVEEFFPAKAKRKKGDTVMRVNMKASHYAAIHNAVQSGIMDFSNATIDVEELKRETELYLGSFSYQTNVEIFSRIIGDSVTLKEMRQVLALETYKAAEGRISSVMQSFITKWTGKTNIDLKRSEIKNFRHKFNVEVTPDDIFDDYLAYLLNEELSPSQQPMIAWIIDNLILPALNDDLEYRAIAKGEYLETEVNEAGVVTQGGNPEDSMDGFETLLVRGKSDANSGYNYFPDARTMAEIKALAQTEGAVVSYINSFAKWISPKFKQVIGKMYVSPEVFEMYKQDYAAKNGASSYLQSTQFAKDQIDFTNFTLVALPSMAGSPIMFATPKENFVYLRWKNIVPKVINDIQKQNYKIKFFGSFYLGVGFPIENYVFAAVPAGYNPKEQVLTNEGPSTAFKQERAEQAALITLNTEAATNAQSVDEGEAIEAIAYAFKGDSASIAWTNTVNAATAPAGIVAAIAGNVITIAGTPTAAAAYDYTITVTGVKGGANATATGTITVIEGV